MTIDTLDLADLMDLAIKAGMANLRIATAATITAVGGAHKVDVQPAIRMRKTNADGEPESFLPAIIQSVPLLLPMMGNAALAIGLTVPATVGDTVLLVFSDRSLDEWLALGLADTEPQDMRRFHASDAVAIPGLFPDLNQPTGAPSDRVRLGQFLAANPCRIEVTTLTGKVRIGNDAAELLAILDAILTELTDVITPLVDFNTGIILPAKGTTIFAPLKTLLATIKE